MTSWLALGEPHTLTVRFPRLKSRDERLRERAEAFVLEQFLREHGQRQYWGPWHRYGAARVQVRLNEREAVQRVLGRIPRWRILLRREVLKQILHNHGVPKWW